MAICRIRNSRRSLTSMSSTTTTGAGHTAGMGSLYEDIEAYWKLDEVSDGDPSGSGSVTRVDSVGNYNLSDNNTVASSTSGKIGNCIDCEKDNTEFLYYNLSGGDSLVGDSGDWTFACWAKPESIINNGRIGAVWPAMGTARSWMVEIRYTNPRYHWSATVYEYDAGGSTIVRATDTSTTSVVSGQWSHLIAQHDDGTHIRLKIDNGSWITTSCTGGIASLGSPPDFKIGGNALFDGLIDEAGFWSRALTDDECSWLYNSGDGLSLY
jgi:hypothetical protein